MISEHDPVVLTRDIDAASLEVGDVGTVVHVHGGGEAYEVEFMRVDGTTVAVETLESAAVRAVRTSDMPHVRYRVA